MLLKSLLAQVLVFMLTACASQVPARTTKADSGPCGALTLDECMSLMDRQQMGDVQRVGTLMAAGAANLSKDNPSAAKIYFDEVVKQDADNAEAYFMLANSEAALALEAQQKNNALDDALASASYAIAGVDYVRAISLDPNNQAAYLGAVAVFAQSGGCDLARSLGEAHRARFGQNDKQASLSGIIQKKCK
ncbi:tetratricopeptide repeat protein [Dongia sp.]|uniref:tetratricopeptide repeat protein n=1 Tax=Dongia sp. TaxID=1977262 RepID=UPI0035B2FF28